MDNTKPEDAKLDEALDGLAKRMAGKPAEEQARMLAEFSKEHYGTKLEERSPQVFLTDEQLSRVLDGTDETKKVIAETAANAERKYKLSAGDARALAEDGV